MVWLFLIAAAVGQIYPRYRGLQIADPWQRITVVEMTPIVVLCRRGLL